jgi:hypothetical protein
LIAVVVKYYLQLKPDYYEVKILLSRFKIELLVNCSCRPIDLHATLIKKKYILSSLGLLNFHELNTPLYAVYIFSGHINFYALACFTLKKIVFESVMPFSLDYSALVIYSTNSYQQTTYIIIGR